MGDPQAGALATDPTNSYGPCDRYGEPYGESCWLFQGFVILRQVDSDAGRALRLCDAAREGRSDRSYESVGHQLAGLFQRGDDWVVEPCGMVTPGAPEVCTGRSAGVRLHGLVGREVKQFCGSVPDRWCSRASPRRRQLSP
jgi:hypothetical protein